MSPLLLGARLTFAGGSEPGGSLLRQRTAWVRFLCLEGNVSSDVENGSYRLQKCVLDAVEDSWHASLVRIELAQTTYRTKRHQCARLRLPSFLTEVLCPDCAIAFDAEHEWHCRGAAGPVEESAVGGIRVGHMRHAPIPNVSLSYDPADHVLLLTVVRRIAPQRFRFRADVRREHLLFARVNVNDSCGV